MMRGISLFVALVSGWAGSVQAQLQMVAGGGTKEDAAPAVDCRLREPFGAEFQPDGSLVVVEMTSGGRVLKIGGDGLLHHWAGTGARSFAGDGGPGVTAAFNGMHNLAVLPNGDVLLADTWNYRIRKIEAATGAVATWAGIGVKGFSGDGGPAKDASFGSIIQIALEPAGKGLLVTDIDHRRIRRIDLMTGKVETVAGNGQKGVPPDGAKAVDAPLVDPRAAVAARDGTIFVLERGGHALREISPQGRIKTVVGTGKAGHAGDGGPGKDAALNGPKHLCLDRDGAVLIADAENHVIRRYDPKTRKIDRVAGTGQPEKGFSPEPLSCPLNRPHGVTLAPNGDLIIVDSYNNRVLRWKR